MVQHLRIVNPCRQDWTTMRHGENDARHCEACGTDVHDLRRLTPDEALRHVRSLRQPTACVRIALAVAVSGCGYAAKPDVAPAPPPPPIAFHPAPVAGPGAPPTPPDRDGDGIADEADACPEVAGASDGDPRENGCPKLIVIESMGMVILQQVHFRPGQATVLSESNALIAETARVLEAHPEITKVAVEGHASSDERDAVRLSEARARAVMERLVAAGIESSRLFSRGHGATMPIEPESTPEGRERNRRVEFHIDADDTGPADAGASCAPRPANAH